MFTNCPKNRNGLFKRLLNSKLCFFSGLKPTGLENRTAAVYVIFYQGDSQAFYGGCAKNIRQRL